MQLNNLQFKNKSINLEPGLPLLIGTSVGGRSGRVTTRTRNNEAWRESYRAFHQALAAADPDSKVYVLVGAQGSGKSTWAAQFARDHPSAIIFDAILVTHRERCPILAATEASGLKAIAVWFKTPLSVCLARNATRPHDEIAPEVGVRNVFAAVEPPSHLEGFHEVLEIQSGDSGSKAIER